jgi:PAS domain S-box-containing protein
MQLIFTGRNVPIQALLKRFVWVYLSIVIVFSIVLLISARNDEQRQLAIRTDRENNEISAFKARTFESFKEIDTDLRVFAQLPILLSFLDNGSPTHRDELDQMFLVLVKENPIYEQARFLDTQGQEVISVNHNQGEPVVVGRQGLQNKAGQDCFDETINLKQGERYVSSLGLNVENGHLEIPYKPLICVGTPVFDSAARKRGVILFNYLAKDLLYVFRRIMPGRDHQSMLLNQDGYWLSSANPADEWGFMQGEKERTFQHDFPDEWHIISTSENGTLLTPRGLFLYDTVRLAFSGRRSCSGKNLLTGASQPVSPPRECYWKIVSFTPAAVLSSNTFYNQPGSKVLLVFIYFFLALAIWIVSIATLRRNQSEEQFRQLSENIHEVFWITDPAKNTMLYVSPAYEEIWGRTVQSLFAAPKSWLEAIHTKDRQRIIDAAMSKQAAGQYDEEYRIVRPNGEIRWISDKAFPVYDSSGAIYRIVGLADDITTRKQDEQAIQEAKERVEIIFNSSPVAILISRLSDGLITDINDAYTNLSGYAKKESTGKTTLDLDFWVNPDDRNEFIHELQTKGCCKNFETQLRKKDGSQIIATISAGIATILDVPHIVSTIQDITERREMDDKLHATTSELKRANAQIEEERAMLAQRVTERTAQLQHANHAKDSFLATMSHEVRTPLAGLLGMMELLSLSKLGKEQSELLDAAQKSGNSLLRIVNDILDWSKIEAGKLELAPRTATLSDMLKSVTSTYTQIASEKDIHLKVELDPELGAAHHFDPLRVSQILNNFISNAIKFTARGTIHIRAGRIASHPDAETVRFSVQDSGVGISPEQQARLFQQYEQASAETARMYGGTGLGLAICRRLAELMGGTLSVVSTPGVGSTFSFTVDLPVAKQTEPNRSQPHREGPDSPAEMPDISPLTLPGRPIRLLIVDDHPLNRMLLKQQLGMLEVGVEQAVDGNEALAKYQAAPFDLIITDCHMPEMDGYELTYRIRELEKSGDKHIPIIAWTANVLTEEAEHCNQVGMDDLLTKPTELADLRAMLVKWLRKIGVQG